MGVTLATTGRLGAGIAIGCIVAVATGIGAVLLARGLWPAYAAAEIGKTYTNAMLLTRLAAAAVCIVVGASATTRVARDSGRAAGWLGSVFLAVSLPIHLFRVWADYPLWYHLAYLIPLLPATAMAGRLAARLFGYAGDRAPSTQSLA